MYTCLFCPRTFRNTGGLACHQPYCKSNPERTQRYRSPDAHTKKGSIPWNKGLVNDSRLKKSEETIAKLKEKANGRALTPEAENIRKQKIKEKAQLNNGGYRQGSGRGKKGWYKGFFCDSSWELAYVIWCLDNNISIVRNTQKYQYTWQDKIRYFIPDFIVDNKLTEIKGYKSPQWFAKKVSTPDIIVLYGEDMKPYIEYVVDRYGKDYIKLYEGR
jgi:hypothetical protein